MSGKYFKKRNFIMLSVSQTVPNLDNLMGFIQKDDRRDVNISQYLKVSTFESESTDMVFFTEEGDRVTISSESQISSEYFNYRNLLMNKNISANVEARNISISSDSKISITVEGDLSEEELKDIKKAIKTVDKIMQALKSGDIESAMKLAFETISLDSISGLSASMELEKNVTVSEQIQASLGEPIAKAGFLKNYGNIRDEIKALSDRILEIINHSGVDKLKILKPFESYLSDLVDNKIDSNKESEDMKGADIFKLTGSMLLDRIKDLRNRSLRENYRHMS